MKNKNDTNVLTTHCKKRNITKNFFVPFVPFLAPTNRYLLFSILCLLFSCVFKIVSPAGYVFLNNTLFIFVSLIFI